MTFLARLRPLAVAGLLMTTLPVAPALAGPAEQAFLQSYIGGWSGSGTLTGGDQDESFNCRVNVTRGAPGKINYAGRCSVASLALSVAGTIAYIDAAGRYEAAMTSNATFSGTAVGRKRGNNVVFDLRETNKDQEGRDMTISAVVSLEGDTMGLEFNYLFHETGDEMHANVAFARTP